MALRVATASNNSFVGQPGRVSHMVAYTMGFATHPLAGTERRL